MLTALYYRRDDLGRGGLLTSAIAGIGHHAGLAGDAVPVSARIGGALPSTS